MSGSSSTWQTPTDARAAPDPSSSPTDSSPAQPAASSGPSAENTGFLRSDTVRKGSAVGEAAPPNDASATARGLDSFNSLDALDGDTRTDEQTNDTETAAVAESTSSELRYFALALIYWHWVRSALGSEFAGSPEVGV